MLLKVIDIVVDNRGPMLYTKLLVVFTSQSKTGLHMYTVCGWEYVNELIVVTWLRSLNGLFVQCYIHKSCFFQHYFHKSAVEEFKFIHGSLLDI